MRVLIVLLIISIAAASANVWKHHVVITGPSGQIRSEYVNTNITSPGSPVSGQMPPTVGESSVENVPAISSVTNRGHSKPSHHDEHGVKGGYGHEGPYQSPVAIMNRKKNKPNGGGKGGSKPVYQQREEVW